MLILEEKDYLEVGKNSLVADYDREILVNLYQPIIGFKAVSLYFSLLAEYENQKISSIITHEIMFTRTQMNASEFVTARMRLEGIGLLKTYLNDLNGTKLYHYEIYAPKTPKLFFDNTLLCGILIQTVGEAEANRLKSIYSINNAPEGKEITASFIEVYSPNFDDPGFRKAMEMGSKNVVARQSAKLNSGFSYELFKQALSSISQINVDSFSVETMKEIERLASLYGVSEESAAQVVQKYYSPTADKGNRLDFDAITKAFAEEINFRSLGRLKPKKRNGEVFSETDLGRKINLFESVSPKKYLSYLQGNTQPSSSDLAILNDISSKFRLPNSVINAIVDYVLTVNDNVLSKPFAEKIAGSVAREGITTAIDAMNYLKKTSGKRKKPKPESQVENNENNETVPEQPTVKVLTREEILKRLEEDEDDGEN